MANFFRNKHRNYDPVWHVQIAMVAAIALQLTLPDKYSVGSHYVIPVIEVLLLIALAFTTPKKRAFQSSARRANAIALIIITSLANGYALFQVANQLLQGGHVNDGRALILTAINIYLTNIVIFALWYWEMDGGGPGKRHAAMQRDLDFSFPQQQNEEIGHPDWKPTFIDYIYLSSTNALAFSPTDTMPLSRRAKMLMLAQSIISLIAVALVAARAVNILN